MSLPNINPSIDAGAGLAHLLVHNAERRPEALAVSCGQTRLSWVALNRLAMEYSAWLLAAGCRPGDRIGMCLPWSCEAIVAMTAIARAQCICVPIDAGLSRAQRDRVAGFSQCRAMLVCDGRSMANDTLTGTGFRGPRSRLIFPKVAAGILSAQIPGDVAAIIVTHVGDGALKGVMVSHTSLLALSAFAGSLGLGEKDRIAAMTPPHLPHSLFDICVAFGAGASLHIAPGLCRDNAASRNRWLCQTGATAWLTTPAALRDLAWMRREQVMPLNRLRHLLWYGDVLATRDLLRLTSLLPEAALTNVYGQLETCIAACFYRVTVPPYSPDMTVPVGVPVPGNQVVIVDDALAPVDQGVVGEICVAGPCLGTGYWQNPESTAAAFLTAADGRRLFRTGDRGYLGYDGMIYLSGSADHRSGRPGRTMEPLQVEHALSTLDEVREAVVVALPGSDAQSIGLGCAFVANKQGRTGRRMAKRIQRDLRALIPAHLVPDRWLQLEAVPGREDGRVDRVQVARLFGASQVEEMHGHV